MKTEYFLVKYQAARDIFFVGWFEKKGENWVVTSGGRFLQSYKDKILETQEANDYHELDWKKTSVYKPESDAGWLDREGNFYGCNSRQHDLVADLFFNKTIGELTRMGWIRVYDKEQWSCDWNEGSDIENGLPTRMTQAQYDWLISHGHKVHESEQPSML